METVYTLTKQQIANIIMAIPGLTVENQHQ